MVAVAARFSLTLRIISHRPASILAGPLLPFVATGSQSNVDFH
jgi:hypothetical protein